MAIARITRISGAITLLITIFSLSLPACPKYSAGTVIGESEVWGLVGHNWGYLTQ